MPPDPYPPLSSALPSTHPSQLPNPHHRRIELQSPADLAYLRANISRAATARLDLHFPPSASSPADPMRALVGELVTRYLERALALAGEGFSVNGSPLVTMPETGGRDVDGLDKELEGVGYTLAPYDAGLSTRLAGLYAELERERLGVSRLRRRAPREAAEREGSGLVEGLGVDGGDGDGKEVEGMLSGEGEEMGLGLGESQGEGEEWEEIQALYEHALGELRRMVGIGGGKGGGGGEGGQGTGASLMETVGKAQRARDVVAEFE